MIAIISMFISSVMSVVWGKIFDHWKFQKLYLYFVTALTIIGFFFPIVSNIHGFFFMVFYIVIGVTEKGIVTIIGPGLV